MTSKQMDMYMSGAYHDDLTKVIEYEKTEFKKAFYKGTDNGWRCYRRNVVKKVKEFNDIYGLGLEADTLMR